MSVNAEDFHTFARRTWDGARAEIDHRNAVSRLYYAAYHACTDGLRAKGHNLRPEIGHYEFCQDLLSRPVGSVLRNLGLALDNLRQRRNAADYAIRIDFPPSATNSAFGAYGNVMRLLKLAQD